MAWIAEDTFDGAGVGSALSLWNGGTGWSGAWTSSSVTTENAPAGGQGGQCAHVPDAAANCERSLTTAVTAGTLSFSIYLSSADSGGNTHSWTIYQGVSNLIIIKVGGTDGGSAGNIAVYNSDTSTYQDVGAISINTWTTILATWGGSVSANKFTTKIGSGSTSAEKGMNGTLSTGMTRFRVDWNADGTSVLDMDDIKNGAATSPVSTATKFTGAMLMGVGQ